MADKESRQIPKPPIDRPLPPDGCPNVDCRVYDINSTPCYRCGYFDTEQQVRAETLKEVGEYIDKQHNILAEDLGYRLAFLDGLAEALKSGTIKE